MTPDDILDERHRLMFSARLSVIYHRRRERFFEILDRLVKCVSLVGGSAVIAKIASGDALTLLGIGIVLSSTVALVFQFSSRATLHSGLAKDWGGLEKDIVSVPASAMCEDALAKYEARAVALDAVEPRYLRALVADCQNELSRATGSEAAVRPVPLRKWILMHAFDFEAPPPTPTQKK